MRTDDDVRRWLASGETSTVEYKRFDGLTDRVRDTLAQEACAFANGRGGVILLGVEDDGSLAGMPEGAWAEALVSLVRDRVDPPLLAHYEEVEREGRRVGIVEIDEGYAKPYAVRRRGHRRYVVRVGTTVREADREELIRLAQGSGAVHVDRTPVPGADPREIDEGAVASYFEDALGVPWRAEPSDVRARMLVNKGLACEHRGELVCTLGGLVLFGREPDRVLPQAAVTWARFAGDDPGSELVGQLRIGRPLGAAIEEVRRILLTSVPPQAVEDAAGRREDREAYPWRDAVHEAVVNALVHRDYARAGARVRVLLFSDRLEIRSPGALPNGLTVEQVRLGATSHRNTLLVEVMHQLGHVETVGRGIHRIFATMRARGAAEPGFAEQAGEVVVTFSPAPV